MTALIELAILVIFLILAVTQVGLPLFGYGRFFWAFRNPERKIAELEAEIEELKVERAVAGVQKLKQELEKGEQNGRGQEGSGGSVSDIPKAEQQADKG